MLSTEIVLEFVEMVKFGPFFEFIIEIKLNDLYSGGQFLTRAESFDVFLYNHEVLSHILELLLFNKLHQLFFNLK